MHCLVWSAVRVAVSSAFNGTAEIAAADYPHLRLFTVGQQSRSDVPLPDLETVEQNVRKRRAAV